MITLSFVIRNKETWEFTERYDISSNDIELDLGFSQCSFESYTPNSVFRNTGYSEFALGPDLFTVDVMSQEVKPYFCLGSVEKIIHNGKDISFSEFAKDENMLKYVKPWTFSNSSEFTVTEDTQYISFSLNSMFYFKIVKT